MRALWLISLALLGGCASQPQTAATPVPATRVAAAEEAPKASTQLAAVVSDEDKEFVPPPGYKERLEGGTRYYCTKITILGSRFPKDDCRTEAELREIEVQKGAMRGNMSYRAGQCTSAAGCANP